MTNIISIDTGIENFDLLWPWRYKKKTILREFCGIRVEIGQ